MSSCQTDWPKSSNCLMRLSAIVVRLPRAARSSARPAACAAVVRAGLRMSFRAFRRFAGGLAGVRRRLDLMRQVFPAEEPQRRRRDPFFREAEMLQHLAAGTRRAVAVDADLGAEFAGVFAP